MPGGGKMTFAKLLTKVYEYETASKCWPTPCGPDYGTDCMPECDPADGSDDCDPYYPYD